MADPLRRLRHRILRAALTGGSGGLVLGLLTLSLSRGPASGHMGRLLAVTLSCAVLALAAFYFRTRGWLMPLKALEGGATGTRAASAAALAVARLPSRVRLGAAVHLGGALLATGIGWKLWVPGVTSGSLFRLALAGSCVMVVSGFLAGFMTQVASRPVLETIIRAGLTVEDAVALATSEQRRFRTFVVQLVAVFAVTGSLLVAQVVMLRPPASPGTLDPMPLLVAALAGLMACLVASAAARDLSRPMREISARAERIRLGHLDPPSLLASDGEVWAMGVAFVRLEGQLGEVLSKLTVASDQLSVTTEGLVGTLGGQEQGAAEQGSALNETSATTEELARSAGQIAENATEVAQVAQRTLQAAQTGQRSAEAFFNAMLGMRQQNQLVADAVIRLNKRIQQIGRIVEFINEIADKTDLLALNAELEGTKAGEVGRGFSLVAAEMRRLAEDVLRSTGQIGRAITDVRDATNAAVMATEAGVKATEQGTSAANEVSERLRGILEHAKETSEAVRSISLATQQQQTGTHQLADAMAEILRITREGSVATLQMRGTNVDLSALARSLRETVRRFEVKGVQAT
ncbi:MAG: methyl-accepting chemotaxis protein [Myxococcota bacterium]|nr:methyl-accepting chemotaxis protein [Myxococcota bacterium]